MGTDRAHHRSTPINLTIVEKASKSNLRFSCLNSSAPSGVRYREAVANGCSGHFRLAWPCRSCGALKIMKLMKTLVVLACLCSLVFGTVVAAEKPPKKLTCCEKAAAEGKECRHKCCVAAHKRSESCEKCNPDRKSVV